MRPAATGEACHIRPMTQEDVPAVAALSEKCFSEPWKAEQLSEALSKPVYFFFVCEKEGEVAGYLGIFVAAGEAGITEIAVDEPYRRQGIGEALLTHLLSKRETLFPEGIFLEVRESNEKARALYEKVGFTDLGCRRNFYQFPTEHARIYGLGRAMGAEHLTKEEHTC